MTTTILSDSAKVPGLLKNIDKVRFNPSAIQRLVLQHLQDVSAATVDIVDPTNPFVFLLESSAVMTAGFCVANEANTRKMYPSMAQTPEDLYIHMSDKDYIDRFASPASTIFSLAIQLDDMLEKMVDDPDTLGKKVTIPRNTEFIIADTVFSLQYPIDIKKLAHGGLQVVYDTDQVSPLQSLSSNVIPYEIKTLGGIDFLYIEFEVTQFKITSVTPSISPSTGFNQTITIEDQFFYARVFFKNSSNAAWQEIYTTHTDQVHDPATPTAVLKVVDNKLNVQIPQIYLSNNLIQGTLRIDVYQTKGAINMSMASYLANAFSANWRNIDKADDTVWSAPIATLSTLPFSTKTVVGGKAELSFDELRLRVIKNAIGDRDLPITNVQIASSLNNKGYGVVKDVDVVTNRVFLATRQLPKPADEKLITAAAASIETFITSIDKAVTYVGVKDNGPRITLTPELVYRNSDGIISVFPKANLTNLLALPGDDIANAVTNNKFLYTPFHYVLDTSSNQFEVRPYYLDKPEARSIRFISQNDTTNLQLNTNQYVLSRNSTGYKLTVVAKGNVAARALASDTVKAQLSYIPVGEDSHAYLNGTLAGRTADNDFVFEFDLATDFDVNTEDSLFLKKFFMFDQTPRLTASSLLNEFDIIYSTTTAMPQNWTASVVDTVIGRFLLPAQIYGITQEKVRLLFGYSLKNLWARSRSVTTAAEYQRYTANVPWTYEKDVYQVDPATGFAFSVVSGDIVYTKLHSAGDPVLDSGGQPTYRHRIGDVMLDDFGVPIPLNQSTVSRQIDMLFIEGAYFFATDPSSAAYRSNAADTIVDWITVDLAAMTPNLLEQTRIYFYPKATMGNIRVLTDGGLLQTIEAGQSFTVNLFVSKLVYDNTQLRETLRKSTIATIDKILEGSSVAVSKMTTALQDVYGDDVKSLELYGLGGDRNLATLTVTGSGERCNIRKRLVKQADDSLIVEEDVTVNFIKHEVNEI